VKHDRLRFYHYAYIGEFKMSKLRTFRIDGYRLDNAETEFLAKIEDDDSYLMGTFDMTGEGVFYYRPKSQIMTEYEKENTRATYDGFISFENLKDIFEKLLASGWDRDRNIIGVSEKNNTIVLRVAEEE
jgi:hypothetical protein